MYVLPHIQGMRLTVAHSPVGIGNVGGLLEGISVVAHRAIGNTYYGCERIYNIMFN